MKKIKLILIGLVVVWITASIAIGWYIYSGRYNFAADDPHWGWVENLIDESVEKSVDRRLSPTPAPDLTHPGVIAAGAGSYDQMCTKCHLSPGVTDTEMRTGMYPQPPNLSREDPENPKEAYWIIKHGIKMSGMPAWGPSHSDEDIWNMVAFLQVLPDLSANDYNDMVRESEKINWDLETFLQVLPDLSADDYYNMVREGEGAVPVVIEGVDEFPLKGSLYASDREGPGVLMLHQCNAERSMYESLGKVLSDAGIHALSVDLRGYGESAQPKFDMKALREEATSREDFMEKAGKVRDLWPADMAAVYDYLAALTNVNGNIGVIGASCGGGQAVQLSAQRDLKTLILFSAGLQAEDISGPVHEFDGPVFAVAAAGDTNAAQAALAVTQAARNENSRLLLYKGDLHGAPLFDKDAGLEQRFVEWFVTQLDAPPADAHHH
ncbi:MAG: alpha/beta fold hydrolase [Gammaproteobacteria bacterium]